MSNISSTYPKPLPAGEGDLEPAICEGPVMSKTVRREDVRNVAIIAHVDHGKTSLVDCVSRRAGGSAKRN